MGGGMGRGHLSEDSKNQACPPSGPVGRVDPTEDARERLQELRSKINPSAEQIPFWTKYDVAASRAVEDSKRWRSRDHRQDLKQWDGRPRPITASMCQSGSVVNHLNRKGRPL
jgi:hypothetical protein